MCVWCLVVFLIIWTSNIFKTVMDLLGTNTLGAMMAAIVIGIANFVIIVALIVISIVVMLVYAIVRMHNNWLMWDISQSLY